MRWHGTNQACRRLHWRELCLINRRKNGRMSWRFKEEVDRRRVAGRSVKRQFNHPLLEEPHW